MTRHFDNQCAGRSAVFSFGRPSCMMHSRVDPERTDVSQYVEWIILVP
jgi:hypothetical protein